MKWWPVESASKNRSATNSIQHDPYTPLPISPAAKRKTLPGNNNNTTHKKWIRREKIIIIKKKKYKPHNGHQRRLRLSPPTKTRISPNGRMVLGSRNRGCRYLCLSPALCTDLRRSSKTDYNILNGYITAWFCDPLS